MKTYIKLAWRNIWRNKRRTIITAASIFAAIFFALIMRAFQIGSYDNMINNIVQSYTGDIQIHAKGFWEDKSIDNTFAINGNAEIRNGTEPEGIDPELHVGLFNSMDNVKLVVPRLESFALASVKDHTKGILVNGVDPEQEDELTGLKGKLIRGNYLTDGSDGVLLGSKLADYLNIDINDTIVLLGQGYHGMSAAGKYPVTGILRFPSPDLDGSIVTMNLNTCQELYGVREENRLTSLTFSLNDHTEIDETAELIKSKLNPEIYEVMTWKDMLTELVQQIESDNISGQIMLGILYMIITFGVFGTVLMMLSERWREFGVMVAVGLKKIKLGFIVIIEMIMIGVLGIISGIIFSIPIVWYFQENPIKLKGEMAEMIESYGMEAVMPMALKADFYINQSLIVILLVIFALIYPLISIFRIKVINALRG